MNTSTPAAEPIFSLAYARHDPATCLAPGLFRSLKKGDRKPLRLDITYDYSRHETIRFWGPEQLGVDDLRVLQVLVAASAPFGRELSLGKPKTEVGAKLSALLEWRFEPGDRSYQGSLVVHRSLPWLLREIGLTDGGKNIKSLRDSLRRMAAITVIVMRGRYEASYRLLSYAMNKESGEFCIALNPRIALAAGFTRQSHTHIKLSEVRALKTGPARLIHQRLCGWINPGSNGRVEIDRLVRYAWPDAASPEAMRKRRQNCKKALEEFSGIGWCVTPYVKGKYDIRRPKNSLP